MKHIIVTGAGSGLGLLFCLEMAKRGHHVTGAVQLPSQVTSLRNEAAQAGVSIHVVKADITDERDRRRLAHQECDIFVNNAGIGEGGTLTDMPSSVLRQQFEVNFFSTLELTQQVIQQFAKRKHPGRIVFVSSIAGIISAPFAGAYCASKHALESAAQTLRQELAPLGISVACLNPGPYQTGFNDRLIEAYTHWYDEKTALLKQSDIPSFPMPQIDPRADSPTMVDILLDEGSRCRNIVPSSMIPDIRAMQDSEWTH